MKHIELRSDTMTLLTNQMRQSILTSQYGDWTYGQDETVKQLQAYAAQLLGTQAAAYTPSATFANQCGLLTAGKPGQQLLIRDGSHIIQHQNGSPGRLARLMTRTIDCPIGYMTPQDIKKNLRKKYDSQCPKTGVLVLQFPTFEGRIPPLDVFHECAKLGQQAGLHVHVDGARFFSAIAQLKIDPAEVMKHCSSLTICLSKGLLAPVGSVIVGTKQFITRFKINQKMIGGVLRKPGVVAGAGLIGLQKMRLELWKDNQITRSIAQKMTELGWFQIVVKVETNLLFFKITDPQINISELSNFLNDNGIFCVLKAGINRFVIHHYIRQAQVQKLVSLFTAFRSQNKLKSE